MFGHFITRITYLGPYLIILEDEKSTVFKKKKCICTPKKL